MQDLLDQIEAKQAALDGHDDTVSAQLAALADLLRRRIRVRVTLDLCDDRSLDFGKIDGAWQFIYGDGDEECALLSCSRDIRSEMLGRVEDLIRAAVAQLDERITERAATVASAAQLIEALRVDPF